LKNRINQQMLTIIYMYKNFTKNLIARILYFDFTVIAATLQIKKSQYKTQPSRRRHASMPPSQIMVVPVVNEEASEAR
jgi:hypothetical protein